MLHLELDMTQKFYAGIGYFLLFLLFCTSTLAVAKKRGDRALWPFDQRQIVLLKKEGFEFPDPKTVAQVMDVYVRLGRVRWMTLKGQPGQINPFEVPNDFEWQSSAAIRNLGIRFEADGLVVLSKKGVQVELQWYSTADGTPLFFETLSLPQASNEEQENQRRERIQAWLHDIWSKIPGEGYVVKRDMETISIEGAEQLGFKVGDILETKRLGKVERHPLLKTLIKIDSSLTGRAEIVQIGKPYTVAKILYESKVDPIQEGDRYLKTESKKTEPGKEGAGSAAPTTENPDQNSPKNESLKKKLDDGREFIPLFGEEKNEENKSAEETKKEAGAEPEKQSSLRKDLGPPTYNFLDLNLSLGYKRMSHQENTLASTDALKEMSAWAPGFQLAGKVFFTKDILVLADFQYSFFSFKGLDTVYGVGTVSSGAYQIGAGVFYRGSILEEPLFQYRGEFRVGLGFRNLNYSMAAITNDVAPSAKKYTGYELMVGLQVPLLPDLAADLSAGKMIMSSLSETEKTGGSDYSNSIWSLRAIGKYKWTRYSEITGGIEIQNALTNYSGTATRTVGSNSTTWSGFGYSVGYTQRF